LLLRTTDITRTGATLNGVINSHDTLTGFDFEYADDATFRNSTADDPYDHRVQLGVIDTHDDEAESAAISGLTPGTTYHVRLHSIGPGGEVVTGDQTFVTAPK
jgi:hypothetical protein